MRRQPWEARYCGGSILGADVLPELRLAVSTVCLVPPRRTHMGDWGPHLVVVPTSVMLNWEMEFKKW